MADPVVIDCVGACTVTVVHELVFPPFQLSIEDAGQIAVSIALVWITGWAIRMVKKVMDQSDPKGENE